MSHRTKTAAGVLCIALALSAASVALLAGTAGAAEQQATIVCDGSTTVGPLAKAFREFYMEGHPGVDIVVSESGSGNGAKSLINGTCDVADMSRFMKPTEFKAAVENGVLPVAHTVAMDGIAVIVHPSNPVSGLAVEQVRAIYAGRITSWDQVGGPTRRIVVVGRDTNSGTYETFESLVMAGEHVAGNVETMGSNGAIRTKVQSTPTAVGYVGLGFTDGVKPLPVNGIVADRLTVASGRYPIARPLFMFTNGYPELGSHLHAFVTLYLTRDGQQIIESLGFVPVTNY